MCRFLHWSEASGAAGWMQGESRGQRGGFAAAGVLILDLAGRAVLSLAAVWAMGHRPWLTWRARWCEDGSESALEQCLELREACAWGNG
jgi:hypothetical protein